jgi:hypothetical protein
MRIQGIARSSAGVEMDKKSYLSALQNADQTR